MVQFCFCFFLKKLSESFSRLTSEVTRGFEAGEVEGRGHGCSGDGGEEEVKFKNLMSFEIVPEKRRSNIEAAEEEEEKQLRQVTQM